MRAAVVIVGLLLASCASQPERYLNAEEDSAMRKQCEPAGGCTVVPNPVWLRIERLLRSLAGTAI